jgi:hypothetical protein
MRKVAETITKMFSRRLAQPPRDFCLMNQELNSNPEGKGVTCDF